MATKPKSYVVHLKWKRLSYPDAIIGEAILTMATIRKIRDKWINEVSVTIYDTSNKPVLSFKKIDDEITALYNKKFPPLKEGK